MRIRMIFGRIGFLHTRYFITLQNERKTQYMIGTLVNTGTILVGSIAGSCLRHGIKEQYRGALFQAMGLAACALGVNAVAQNMPNSTFPVLFILSLAVGTLTGTMLDIDGRFQRLVGRFSKDGGLGQGLSTAILLFCIGTLSILGPINSALYGDHTYLFTNATLDLATSMTLASTYGIGIACAAGVLFCWQGAIYLCAGALSGFLTDALMTEVSIIGGILIAASGLSMLNIRDCKTLNMLPSLAVPVIWFAIKALL